MRIEIDFPASVVTGSQNAVVVWGYDASGKKLVVQEDEIALRGVLERPICGDMDFLCGVAGPSVVARTPGRGTITVKFHGLTAARDVVAVAPADAGGA